MAKTNSHIISQEKIEMYKDNFLVFILLVLSGNTIMRLAENILTILACAIAVCVIGKKVLKMKVFFSFLFKIFFFLSILFCFQKTILGFVSWAGVINFFVKIFTGGIIIYHLRDRFPYRFFQMMYYLSLISLCMFVVINLLNVQMPHVKISEGRFSYFVYATSASHFHQNQGMFWEPGANSGIITICLALNFPFLKIYWLKNKKMVIILLLTLLSTQSTTGYLSGFVVFAFLFIDKTSIAVKIVSLLLLSFIAFFAYNNLDFLKEKIERQSKMAIDLDENEFSNTRFGSLIFDAHYIQKHYLIGNGMHEKTRYADNPELIQMIKSGKDIGHGNGLTNFTAALGIPFMILYFVLVFFALKEVQLTYAILVVLILIMNLMGEQWLNFPLFLGIPFTFLYSRKYFYYDFLLNLINVKRQYRNIHNNSSI